MESNNIPVGSVSLAQIEQSRKQMHRNIDDQYDVLVRKILMEDRCIELEPDEQVLALVTDPARFKGTKPSHLLLPDGRTIPISKWKQTITELLADCNKDSVMHDRMMQLRDRVSGRLRSLLSASPDGMSVPIKIDEDLYLEGKLDTEFLLKIVRDQILDPVGYECGKVGIVVYDPKQEMSVQTQEMRL